MPTLRIFEGSEPTRDPAEGMLFDRLPIPVRRDPRIRSGAKVQLAAIIPKGGPWPNWVERSDEWVKEETGLAMTTIQENWRGLEEAGYIRRVRRRGHRRIYLLFDLAGRMHSRDSVSALTEIRQSTSGNPSMHSRDSASPSLREREIKILRPEGGSPSATSPGDGGSPSTTPTGGTKTDPAPQADWTEAKATPDELAYWRTQLETHGPRSPLGQLARKILGLPQNQERPADEESSPAGPTGPGPSPAGDVEKPGPGTPAKDPQDPASRADMIWPSPSYPE